VGKSAGDDKGVTFVLPTHGSGGLQPGVDLEDAEALAESIGDNTLLKPP